VSVKTLPKDRGTKNRPSDAPDMLPEYRLDYSKARPNRFAERVRPGGRLVVLDPDVAKAFATPESVNAALRALIGTKTARRRSNGKA